MNVLQFSPFSSSIDTSFWHAFTQKKLESLKLSEETIQISASLTNTDPVGFAPRVSIDYNAFDSNVILPNGYYIAPGSMLNYNTIEKFQTSDKKLLLNNERDKIWHSINNEKSLDDPSFLNAFLLVAFADLKKYNFSFWFAFPALMPNEPITFETISKLPTKWNNAKIEHFLATFDTFKVSCKFGGFFLIEDYNTNEVRIGKISEYNSFFQDPNSTILLGICDPSTTDDTPGWPLRNYLILASRLWKGRSVDVLCLRDRHFEGKRHTENSFYIAKVNLPDLSQQLEPLKCTGWERNDNQKLAPKKINLSSTMNPERLSEQAVDLNLKLMRWRLLPELNLDDIRATKCLLLGAGTLGCNVARCLLGWGVRHVTFVDNGSVAYSNPVRQSLYSFEDSLHGGQPKAETAANSLKKIFPGIYAKGYNMSIPMPGHTVSENEMESVKSDVAQLEQLINEHDIVFLLLDTRESRWLPTVLCAAFNKICINAALGFDTYLVMRHGSRTDMANDQLPVAKKGVILGNQLGCYFCNDVVGPTDSTKDRTLDQQCTVSRPGMAYITSALAVELAVSLIQHPLKGAAPADMNEDFESQCCLGAIPHQIRGFLSRFQTVHPSSMIFDCCTGCSDVVIQKYKKDAFAFLIHVFNVPSFLEDLTGLTKLFENTKDIELLDMISDEETSDS